MHAAEEGYLSFLRHRSVGKVRESLLARRRFVERYPDLREWFEAPLAERVGYLYGDGRRPSYPVSAAARPYIKFLAASGYAHLDWEWLLAVGSLTFPEHPLYARFGAEVAELVERALALGYRHTTAKHALNWLVPRLCMHDPDLRAGTIREGLILEFEEAVRAFGRRPDVHLFFGSAEGWEKAAQGYWSRLHLLRVVLYHRGQVATEPRKGHFVAPKPPVGKPRMEAVAARYVAARRATDRWRTVDRIRRDLRTLVEWLAEAHPEMESFAEVDRDHLLEFSAALEERPAESTGRPLAPLTRYHLLSNLSVFFRLTAEWGWEDVPGRPLLGLGDFPKKVESVPRYIPDEELSRLMEGVRSLECPYQRGALLIARWSGARRDEILRLETDCLDAYPDGTPRLRIPAGKTYRERVIPLNEEAAEAIRTLKALRREDERGFRDELAGRETLRLFVNHGKPFSAYYLFETSLHKACRRAGLLTPDGKPTVSAHRFRHTVGRQLAERGARMNTIMKVLGHQSANMSMVYARISDRAVLEDYRKVLGPGAAIAGPLAETLRNGEMPAADVEWIKANFFETELELGRCLRLPQEGPCECDLYLSCPKFVTAKEYAPRLRSRRQKEFGLIEEAACNGYQREVERHHATVRRIEQLLADLGEPLDDRQAG
jgi:integrase